MLEKSNVHLARRNSAIGANVSNPVRVMIVDDHHLVRAGMVRMLGDEPDIEIVAEAESGEQALERVTECRPNVILMDVRMPGIGGLEATRKILRLGLDIRIIVLTACSDTPYPQRLLEVGASGFITKESEVSEVILAIRQVAQGKRYISQSVAQEMALSTESNDSPFEKLTERELQIALMVIDGIKTADIATRLCVSPKTVNTYRYRLFEKLGIRNNMDLALVAVKYGLITPDESRILREE